MNMLIIGNGFDLAHGRPTKYEDFLRFTGPIMRTKNYRGDYGEFEKAMPKLHPNIKKYILKAFNTRFCSIRGETDNANQTIQKIYGCLEENVWHDYFQSSIRKNRIRGKNWVDFESEIRAIIELFDRKLCDLYSQFCIEEIFPAATTTPMENAERIKLFCSQLKFSRYNIAKNRFKDQKVNCLDFIEKSYQDLERLIQCLEIYLDICAKIPIDCYSPDIQGLAIDFVLSFNYTPIPVDIYPLLTNVHYIHGRAVTDRPEAKNNMVLGVNEYWEGPDKNTHTNFNLYKKFVQRIIKETGIDYKKALKYMGTEDNKRKTILENQNSNSPYTNHIYIFGHSLDVTDGDILREIIETDDADTTIFYRDKPQQANQIANLSKVLGQDELLKRTFSTSPTIIFKQQTEMAARW